jgi:hypothetical protein
MGEEEQINRVVEEVLRRLALRRIADGDDGRCATDILVVLTAATVGYEEAVHQVQLLGRDGFGVRLAFSQAAEDLFGSFVRERLEGFPRVTCMEPPESWLSHLKRVCGVVVPLLSLNSASKLSLLIADNTAANIILHGLLMGKPVIMAVNGVDPAAGGREMLGFHKGNAALKRAILQRLQTLADFGCTLVDVKDLGSTVKAMLHGQGTSGRSLASYASPSPPPAISRRIITAADVLGARLSGASPEAGPEARMTPLARDLVKRYGAL